MTHRQSKMHLLINSLGTALLLFGAVLCYLRIEAVSQQMTNVLAAYGSEAVGLFPATGLAATRVLQDLALNPASALSASLQFLLSFWPVAIIVLGALLLRKTIFPIISLPLSTAQDSGSVTQGVRE
jgi:hypothetical protein